MKRRRVAFIALFLLLAVCAVGGSLFWALVQVPDFYQEELATPVDPEVRRAVAKKFVQQTLRLADDIAHADDWSQEFTQRQVNSWLAEELHAKYAKLVPPGVSRPRVRFLDKTVLIGFRFEQKRFSGIVSLRLKPWVSQPNQLTLEVMSVRAGLVPIPLDDVLGTITRRLEYSGWQTEWRQHDGNDVLIVHLERPGPHRPVLESVDVAEGVLRIHGERATDSAKPQQTDQESAKVRRVAIQSGLK